MGDKDGLCVDCEVDLTAPFDAPLMRNDRCVDCSRVVILQQAKRIADLERERDEAIENFDDLRALNLLLERERDDLKDQLASAEADIHDWEETALRQGKRNEELDGLLREARQEAMGACPEEDCWCRPCVMARKIDEYLRNVPKTTEGGE